jgi:hypothetical protein
MDQARFDFLTRTLTATRSRRDTFRSLAIVSLSFGAVHLGVEHAAAKGKKLRARCKKTEDCKGKLVCKKANAQHHYPKTQKRCCVKKGGRCEDFLDCCGIDVKCDGVKCVSL